MLDTDVCVELCKHLFCQEEELIQAIVKGAPNK